MPVSWNQFDEKGPALACADCGGPLSEAMLCSRCAPVSSRAFSEIDSANLPVVRRSWPATIVWAALFLFAAATGVNSCLHGSYFKACWILLGSLLLLVLAILSRTSTCPHCSGKISRVAGIGACPHCGGYHVSREGRVHPVGEGFIASIPAFASPLAKLPSPEEWKWPWPGSCAVCGAPATRSEKLRVSVPVVVASSVLETTAIAEWSFLVPHCTQHRKAVEFDKDDPSGPRMKFRAWNYWRDFRDANLR